MLAPPEGLRAPGVPEVKPGVEPRSQGVIPRRFKRKKNFVTDAGRTDRRVGRNSDVDMVSIYNTKLTYSMKVFEIFNQICMKMKSVLYAIPKFKIVG